jgi:hypothetical protein
MTSSLLLDAALETATYLERVDLRSGMNEHWLRDKIFEYPRIIPLNRIDPGAGDFISVCREFPLSKYGSSVFVDVFGVTRHGRPVLIECKLWRNPQARREVIAQLLEYASLFRRLSYSDLTATLKSRFGMTGQNPLYDLVAGLPDAATEDEFTDRVASSLARGDIELIIAGDGIREDTAAIAEHLLDRGARLTLLELQVWKDGNGQHLLVPHIPFRTEILRQRVLVDGQDRPLVTEDVSEEEVGPPGINGSDVRSANRSFWDRFISTVRFDHPDQTKPTHGGNNWVRISMPRPGRWLTGYRTQDSLGFYLVQDDSVDLHGLIEEANALKDETGLPDLRVEAGKKPGVVTIAISRPITEIGNEDAQLRWLTDTANRLVNSVRPRLAHRSSD